MVRWSLSWYIYLRCVNYFPRYSTTTVTINVKATIIDGVIIHLAILHQILYKDKNLWWIGRSFTCHTTITYANLSSNQSLGDVSSSTSTRITVAHLRVIVVDGLIIHSLVEHGSRLYVCHLVLEPHQLVTPRTMNHTIYRKIKVIEQWLHTNPMISLVSLRYLHRLDFKICKVTMAVENLYYI